MPGWSTGLSERLVARNFLTLGSGEAVARLVAFGATVYVARVLGAEAFGVIGFAGALLLYLNRVVDGGLELGLGVQLVAEDRDRLRDEAAELLTARVLLGVAMAALLAVVGLVLVPPPDGPVLAAYGLTLLAVGAGTRWIHFGLERTRVVAGARIAGELVMVGLVLLVVRGPGDLLAVPLAQALGDALAATVLFLWLRRWGVRPRLRLGWETVRRYLPRAWPLVGASLLGLLIYNSDLIFLRLLRDASAVGLYVAAYALISFLSNMGTAYGMSLLPTLTRLGREDAAEERGLYRSALAQVFAAGLPVAVGTTILAPGIIGLVFGAEYGASALPLRILIWSVTLALVREVAVVGLMARGREDRVFRLTAWATASNLALNVLLIPPLGMVGAAAATVATEAGRMALALRFAAGEGLTPARLRRLWPAALAAAGMGALLLLWRPGLWLGVPAGVASYGALLLGAEALRRARGRRPTPGREPDRGT